jgi:hypothetical protein
MTSAFTGLVVVSLVAGGLTVLCFREMRLRRACQMLIARLFTALHTLYRKTTGDQPQHDAKPRPANFRR